MYVGDGFGAPLEDLPPSCEKKFEVACKRGACEIVTRSTTAKGIVKVTPKGVANLRCTRKITVKIKVLNKTNWRYGAWVIVNDEKPQ